MDEPNTPGPQPAPQATDRAPPIAPGQIARPAPSDRPKWPTVIGTLVIVFSGLGVLAGVLGIMGALVLLFSADLFAGLQNAPGAGGGPDSADTAAIAEAYRMQGLLSIPMSLALLAVHTLGVFAGVLLSKRRARAARLCRAWAWLRMVVFLVVGLGQGWLQMVMMDAVAQAAARDAQAPAGLDTMFAGFGIAGAVFAVVWQILWGWSLAIVVLWWLHKPASRELVAQWRAAEEGTV